MFFKIGILKNFANFTGKHLCWSEEVWLESLFNKVVACNFIKKGLYETMFPPIPIHSPRLPSTLTHFHTLSSTLTYSHRLPPTPTHCHPLPPTPIYSHSFPSTPIHYDSFLLQLIEQILTL